MLDPFHAAAQSGAPWKHESFAARVVLPALKGRPPGYTVPKRDGQATAACSQESSTAMARPMRVKTRTCAWQVGVWWRARAPDSPSRSLERCPSSFKKSMEQSSSGFSCSCALRAPAHNVKDSSFVEQGVDQRARRATVATCDARSMPGEAWATTYLSVRKVKAHTAACKSPNFRKARLTAISAVTRVAHWIARVGSARQRLDIDSTWILGRGRATARRRERERP